ncbi:MAG TPA: HAD hydrolase-like protein [Ottowia sp.]|uniref:HAD family hydrolase n=1 Tax=Ottowia sp. TaxID=1898956 RepID=UPI002B6D045D|nr:HAD family hydrolase [Ottowia sp.]HMN21226.1 HAD hydrolase-like protein [Ottowia sp.]
MLDARRIRAITLDLDDTLWPVWPTIRRADAITRDWLAAHGAGNTAVRAADAQVALQARQRVLAERPAIAHDLGALKREVIRLLLRDSGDDPALAEPAFAIFHRERQRVTLFDDALEALRFLAARWPLVALSNGNADVAQTGVGPFFAGAVSAASVGVAKPDARIFHAGAAVGGVAPHEVLHVGDDAELDAAGALAVGMQVAWVNRDGVAWPDGRATRPQVEVRDLKMLCAALA